MDLDQESKDPSDVIVHGQGCVEEVLEVLHDITDKFRTGAPEPEASRQFANDDEFGALVQRVSAGEASVKLRKLFLYSGQCNVMQEIWIQDKKNPKAVVDPLKSYTVIHVHHHAAVSCAREIKPEHLEEVDSINARHLAVNGSKYQRDNPFFDTFIEPSGRAIFKPRSRSSRKRSGFVSNAASQTIRVRWPVVEREEVGRARVFGHAHHGSGNIRGCPKNTIRAWPKYSHVRRPL